MAFSIYDDQINKLYDSVIWTHKIQRSYLETLELRRKVFAIIQIVFSALASTATVLFAIFGNATGTILSSVATMLAIIFSAILDKVETKDNIDAFKNSSSSLWLLRGRLEDMASLVKNNKLSNDEILRTLDSLKESFDIINRNLPTIPNKYVAVAKDKLDIRKDEETNNQLL